MGTDYAHETNDQKTGSGTVVMCVGACVSFYSRTPKCIRLCTGSGVRGDGNGNLRDDFHTVCPEFQFPDSDVGLTAVKRDNKGAIH